MILSSKALRELINKAPSDGGVVIEPYSEGSQQPASYDLRASEDTLLKKGMMTLVSSVELVELPVDIAATLRCRSSYARRGVFISGGFVDPGFRGHLTLCLLNMGEVDLPLPKGERIVQIIFSKVFDGEELYHGKYQDSHGVVSAR